MGTYALSKNDGKSICQPLYEAKDEIHENSGRPNCGKGILPYRLPYYYSIGKGIEKLKQITADNRYRELKYD